MDRKLWDRIKLRAKDGNIDKRDAVKMWEDAMDGPGLTKTEQATFEKALKEFDFTAGAKKFLETEIAAL